MDQSLSDSFVKVFPTSDRAKGTQLFRNGKVQIVDAGTLGILGFVVSDSAAYSVMIDLAELDDGALGFFCKCPRFEQEGFCKHVWAFLLEVDRSYNLGHLHEELVAFYECEPSEVRIGLRIPKRSSSQGSSSVSTPVVATPKSWQRQLNHILHLDASQRAFVPPASPSLKGTRLWFSLALNQTLSDPLFSVRVHASEMKTDGTWTAPNVRRISDEIFRAPADYESREVLSLLQLERSPATYSYNDPVVKLRLPSDRLEETLRKLTASNRFVWTMDSVSTLEEYRVLSLDDRGTWQLRLNIFRPQPDMIRVAPRLYRVTQSGETETRDIDQIVGVCDTGVLLFQHEVGIIQKSDTGSARGWQHITKLEIPSDDFSEMMSELVNAPSLPEIEWDESLAISRLETKPKGKLILEYPDFVHDPSLRAKVSFVYDQFEVDSENANKLDWDSDKQRLIIRDMDAESKLVLPLARFAFQESIHSFSGRQYVIHRKWLPDLVKGLSECGWEVVVGGKKIRSCSKFSLKVQSGKDWFDVDAEIDFDGFSTKLPELLKAVKQGNKFVVLDDGSEGMLPEEWLGRLDRLAQLGVVDENGMRFQTNQALMLDMLLAEQENVFVDKSFSTICNKLKSFSGIAAAEQPKGFHGEMRQYQREGLGWFGFLREFGFGGCLADDMGLGKTIQVLALLEQRRARRLKKNEARRPSIAIVPKSLIFNWIDEAKRFAPKLKIVDYTGVDREDRFSQITDCDLILTTYATFRLDIEKLKDIEFDYAILDEAQAIKNPGSLAAKAVRLIKSGQRLAMTGTPVENHLGDLWSLFEFLNPGMLGSSLASTLTAKGDDQAARLTALNQALKPFILRRTKEQVLTELPEKTEQTLFCEMSPNQKKLYNELRDHYRASLDKSIKLVGIKRSKFQVLEALLRLRQTACDPKLIDASQKTVGSKIELLIEQVAELIDEGHKVLIFSQFTSLLALVKKELDKHKWKYEYLDGSSNRRAESVKRFQEDPDCQLFLISLKAGGHGLNLTAADYVFILDPWWNPAVEAQAVDRAHRMGQQNHVVAYRMITKGTVEEKIVELQKSKRELADAIISADQNLIQSLSLDDLRVLFE